MHSSSTGCHHEIWICSTSTGYVHAYEFAFVCAIWTSHQYAMITNNNIYINCSPSQVCILVQSVSVLLLVTSEECLYKITNIDCQSVWCIVPCAQSCSDPLPISLPSVYTKVVICMMSSAVTILELTVLSSSGIMMSLL